MKWFEISNLTLDVCSSISREWMYNIGYNITEPSWSIRPYKIPQEELFHISPICDIIPVKMARAALIMTPASTICKTHVDAEATSGDISSAKYFGKARRQRITAINIPINVEANSLFQYMDGDKVVETIDLLTTKCWDVSIPHRVDNSNSIQNRVVLSLGFYETVEDIYTAIVTHCPKLKCYPGPGPQ